MLKYKSEDVVKELACEIRAGVFKSDSSFPCDRDIARRFGVSRATAREATSCLKSAGLIASRRGAGTFLAPQAGRGSGIIGAVLCDSAAVSALREAGGEIARSVSSRGYSLSLNDCVSPSRQKTFAEVRRAVRNLAAMGALGMVYEPVGMSPEHRCVDESAISLGRAAGLKIVLLHAMADVPRWTDGCDLVGVDMFAAGKIAGRMARERGVGSVALDSAGFSEDARRQFAAGVDYSTDGSVAAVAADDETVGMLFVDGSENCAGTEQSPTAVGIVPDMKRIASRAVRYLVNHIAHPGRSIVVDLIPPLIG